MIADHDYYLDKVVRIGSVIGIKLRRYTKHGGNQTTHIYLESVCDGITSSSESPLRLAMPR